MWPCGGALSWVRTQMSSTPNTRSVRLNVSFCRQSQEKKAGLPQSLHPWNCTEAGLWWKSTVFSGIPTSVFTIFRSSHPKTPCGSPWIGALDMSTSFILYLQHNAHNVDCCILDHITALASGSQGQMCCCYRGVWPTRGSPTAQNCVLAVVD